MFFFIFLLIGVSFATLLPKNHNCNTMADRNADWMNRITQLRNATVVHLPGGELNEFKFKNVTLIGADSLRRTGPCRLERIGKCIIVDSHFGLDLAVLFIEEFEYDDLNMTAFARSLQNSVHHRIKFCGYPCRITVEMFQLEKLGNVQFFTSHRGVNILDLRGIFFRRGRSVIQKYLDVYARKIEKEMNEESCLDAHLFSATMPLRLFV
nr:uncharacterized protein LOC106687668 [Halyomorpha halys]